MTAQRPNPQHPNSHSGDDMLKKKRGPINKRACERCRQGKVRCDGNAETQRPCSNCIPDQCVYDQSPRKNKQLEHMKQKLDNTEHNLREKKRLSDDQEITIRMLHLEKKVMGMLIELPDDLYLEYKEVFQTLHKAVSESKVFENILFLIEECLGRLKNRDEQRSAVIESLKHVATATASLPANVSIDVALGKRTDYAEIAADIDMSYREYLALPSDQRNQFRAPGSDDSKKESIGDNIVSHPDVIITIPNTMSIDTVISPDIMSDRSSSDCCTPSPQTSFPFDEGVGVISPIELNKFYSQASYLSASYQSTGSSTTSTEYGSWLLPSYMTFE